MNHRHAVRFATIPAVAVPGVLAAAPAAAATSGWNGTGLTAFQMVWVFIGIPIGLFAVISLLFVLLPAWARESRGRGGVWTTAEPAWFAGPSDSGQALQVAEPSQGGGGASAGW